jgi:hypothetical protein
MEYKKALDVPLAAAAAPEHSHHLLSTKSRRARPKSVEVRSTNPPPEEQIEEQIEQAVPQDGGVHKSQQVQEPSKDDIPDTSAATTLTETSLEAALKVTTACSRNKTLVEGWTGCQQ